MNIFLTLDYEIYFGKRHGSVERCILLPTRELIRIGDETGARMTFFVDIGFILKLEEFKKDYPQLETDYQAITDQISTLVAKGHDCQLHIHPHWEDSTYNGSSWDICVDRYKLADFAKEEVTSIVRKYHGGLARLTGKPITSYRAGGWCLQPFSQVRDVFEELGIRLDSTVFKGGHFESKHYYYDFRTCPEKTRWQFDSALCEEEVNGKFLEIPITSRKSNPLFFWRLFLRGRLDPKNHKPIGDGFPVATPGARKKVLTRFTTNPVSLDGYFATQLSKSLREVKRKKQGQDMVVIGHPKACTWYSLKQLQKFIEKASKSNQFKTFSEVS